MYTHGLLLALLILVAPQVMGSDHDNQLTTLEIAVFEYPPLYHTGIDGEFSGTMGETVKQICVEAQLDCHFRMRPVARAYQEIEKGVAQALITVQFERFNSCCVKSDWNYPWRSGLFSKHPADQIPTSLAQLTGQTLILIEGWQSPYSFLTELPAAEEEGRVTVYRANSSPSALLMLHNDRGDYLWGGEEFYLHMEQMELPAFNFKPLLEIPMVLWFAKDEVELLERFNQGFRRLLDKGVLDDNNVLIERLMKQHYQPPLLDLQRGE